MALNGEVRVVDDVPAEFCAVMAEAWEGRPNRGFTVALSGGQTARACYERLADWEASPIDWMSTEVYWTDERCVPHDHPDSNYALARDALFSHVGGVHALFPMMCDEGDDAYNLLITSLGALDVVHLGVGTDGHTASLFPGSDAVAADPGRLVVSTHDPSGANPHARMTMTFSGIRRARLAVVTVAGPTKRDVFAALEASADLPAARIEADTVLWLVDREAAGRN